MLGQVDAPQEADALLLLGEVQEQLHDPEAVLGEVALPVVDRAVAALPDVVLVASRGSFWRIEVLRVHPDDQHLLVVRAVEDADLAARAAGAAGSGAGSPGRVRSADGTLKLSTLTPCGLTPLITWRIVPSLPAASSAWSTTTTPWVSWAASRSWYSESSSTPSVSRSAPSFFCSTPALNAGSKSLARTSRASPGSRETVR